MAFSLTWLPEVLHNAGLKVAETNGWTMRGLGDMGAPRGVMLHHTGVRTQGNMPTLSALTNGIAGLPGPLAQLGVGRDGTFYVIAAGRANHAGIGKWEGVASGNASFIGIQAEYAGGAGDAWPDVQMDAMRRGVAAILRRIGAEPRLCCGHAEYALPGGRRTDALEMAAFRSEVADVIRRVAVVRPQIPAADADGRLTLRRGARGKAVGIVQRRVGLPQDGRFGPRTEAAVRAFQRKEDLAPDGIVGPLTWGAIIRPAKGPDPRAPLSGAAGPKQGAGSRPNSGRANGAAPPRG